MAVKSSTRQFTFPSFYDIPPFYTIQPTLNTKKKQLQLWGDLILDYAKFHKKYDFDLLEASKSPLFNNTKINRKLSVDAIRTIFDELVTQGNGEWQDKEHNRITIYWRSPEEWANILYKWVFDSGKTNTVLTVFELQQGDETQGEVEDACAEVVVNGSLEALQSSDKSLKMTAAALVYNYCLSLEKNLNENVVKCISAILNQLQKHQENDDESVCRMLYSLGHLALNNADGAAFIQSLDFSVVASVLNRSHNPKVRQLTNEIGTLLP